MLKKRFFKTKTECEVAFEILPDDTERVDLLCEANGWEPIEMKKGRNGAFRAKMRLPKEQRFQFRYLLDNTKWVNDETADGYCRNKFGGEDSILDTTPAA